MNLAKYRKAIVAAVASAIATVYTIVKGGEPDDIPGMTEAIIGIIATLLVYFVPNEN